MANTPPYVHQSYPAIRYHKDHPPRKVNDPNEDAALGPGWVKSPALINVPPPVPVALCPMCGQPAALGPGYEPPVVAAPVSAGTTIDGGTVEPVATPDPAEPPAPPVDREAELEEEARKAQFSMSVSGIEAALSGVEDAGVLERIRARERQNPAHEGGRKGVLQAIERRLKALGVASAEPSEEPIAP